MNDPRARDGSFFRMLKKARRLIAARDRPDFLGHDASVTPPAAPQNAAELINEGLRQRQVLGAGAAMPLFKRAAECDPNSHLPFFMLGNAASEMGDLDEAVVYYQRARDLQPNNHVIRYNLGLNHFWRGFTDLAIEELATACRLEPDYLPARSTYIMAILNSDRFSPEQVATSIRDWGAYFGARHPQRAQVPSLEVSESKRLRVGFVSGDFRAHSVAHFFEPIASGGPRDSVEYVLYNNSSHQDAVTQRLRAAADGWRDVWQLSDDALIEMIIADHIDILVDLSGHTVSNRLSVFARRAAPVQVTYLGFPGSTGLASMDYRITDAVTDPARLADAWHSERLLHLPHAQWCFRPFGAPTEPGPLPALEAGFITFGSFNNLTKASDTVLRCWVRILAGSKNSRLRLTRIRSPQRAAEIVAKFVRAGIEAQRIDCVPYRGEAPYGLQFAGVDIALDHYPYNGVTTTCESLYVGVPVISLHGTNCVSRSGLSILGTLGLSELVASSPDRYVSAALALANDLPRLQELRASMRSRLEQSLLRDEKSFAADFAKLLQSAWAQRNELRRT
jgi:protein O-GlcNAc transferase